MKKDANCIGSRVTVAEERDGEGIDLRCSQPSSQTLPTCGEFKQWSSNPL